MLHKNPQAHYIERYISKTEQYIKKLETPSGATKIVLDCYLISGHLYGSESCVTQIYLKQK